MMTNLARSAPSPAARSAWQEAEVVIDLGGGRFRLTDGKGARQAVSCLVGPAPGDRVLLFLGSDGARTIVHVLDRPGSTEARLSVPGAESLTLAAPNVSLQAGEQLTLASDQRMEIVAPDLISLTARRLQLTVLDDLIQTARHVVSRCEHFVQEARGLLRMHGRQAIVTADEDVRVDAQRISMG